MRLATCLLVLALGCGKRDHEEPAAAAPPRATTRLRPIAELRADSRLVAGTRRIGVRVGEDGWYEPGPDGALVARPEIGAAIAAQLGQLGSALADVYLGITPIVVGGAEHHEQHIRIGPEPQRIELEGLMTQVATAGTAELWRYEHELRTELAVVDARGAVTPQAGFPLLGPAEPGMSPVSAKLCAMPKVKDLAGDGETIAALVLECSAEAPVRIASYRWPGPSVTTRQLASPATLELGPERIALTRSGAPVLVGHRGARLAIARIGAAGDVTVTLGPGGVSNIFAAVVADDGAVWTHSLGADPDGRDRWLVARDGVVVELASPDGVALRAERLALGDRLGVVVFARAGQHRWLFAERPPAGPPLVLTGAMR